MSGRIREGNSLGPPGKSVHHSEKVSESTRRWKRTNQIHVDVVKTTMGNLKCRERGPDVLMYLGGLAGDASLSPEAHLPADAVPDELACNELPCGTYGGMGQIEYCAPPPNRDNGSRLACGGVTKESFPVWTKTDVLQPESGDGSAIRLYIGVLPLTGGVVHSLVEGIDGGSGQCVSHMVVLALDMSDVRGELGDVCEVSLLTT